MTPCVRSAVRDRRDVEFVSSADRRRGWLYLPADRNFGNSGGELRPMLSVGSQLEDRDAVAHRPGRGVRSVAAPLSVFISDSDCVTPPRATLRHVRRAPHLQMHHDSVEHVDVSVGDTVERLVERQPDLLVRHVAVPA